MQLERTGLTSPALQASTQPHVHHRSSQKNNDCNGMGFCRLRRDRTLCKRFVYHQFDRIRETAGCLGATERTGELTAGENLIWSWDLHGNGKRH